MRSYVCENCGVAYSKRQVGSRFCTRRCANTVSVKRGREHPWYNGGVTFNRTLGRWMIVCRDGTQMTFARGVVAARVGRLLRTDELVHHVNGDATDDDDSNLAVVSRSEHARIHADEITEARKAAEVLNGRRR